LTILSAWSVRHSLALLLLLRMLQWRSPSGEVLSGGGREAGSWTSDRGGDTSFGGILRALSRSSSDSRCSMISVDTDDEARPTFGSVPNMAVYAVRFIPAWSVTIGYISQSHTLHRFPFKQIFIVNWLLLSLLHSWGAQLPTSVRLLLPV